MPVSQTRHAAEAGPGMRGFLFREKRVPDQVFRQSGFSRWNNLPASSLVPHQGKRRAWTVPLFFIRKRFFSHIVPSYHSHIGTWDASIPGTPVSFAFFETSRQLNILLRSMGRYHSFRHPQKKPGPEPEPDTPMTKNTRSNSSNTAIESRVPGQTNPAGADYPVTRSRDIYEDARGFTYQSVRFCDLNRICDK